MRLARSAVAAHARNRGHDVDEPRPLAPATPPWSPFILAESQRGSNGIIGSNTVTYRSAIHDPRREPARFRRFNRSRYKPRRGGAPPQGQPRAIGRSRDASHPPCRLPSAGPRAEEHRADRIRSLLRRRRALTSLGDAAAREGHHAGRHGRGRRCRLPFLGALLRPDHERAHPPAADAAGQLGPRGFLRLPFALFAHAAFRRGDHDRAYRCRLHFVRAHPRGHRPRRRLRGHQAARRRLPGRSGAHVRSGHRQAVGRRRREAFEGSLDAHRLAQGGRRHAPALR